MSTNPRDNEPQPGPGDASARFGDAAAWRRLLSSDSLDGFSSAWLEIFCAAIDLALGPLIGQDKVVYQAMVALGDPETNKYARTGSYGSDKEASLLLAKAAERAMQLRRGTVQRDDTREVPCQLGHPIMVGDRLRGVVAIELAPGARDHLDHAMRLAQWGIPWFARLFQPGQEVAPGTRIDALEIEAVRLAGAGQTASGAAESLATMLAGRLNLRKVSFGIRRHLQTKLLAVSDGGFASVLNDYLSVIVAAMDEAADSDAAILYPLSVGALARPHAAHARLCREHECDWALSVAATVSWTALQDAKLMLTAEGAGAPPESTERTLETVIAAIAPILLARLRAERSFPAHLRESIRFVWHRNFTAAAGTRRWLIVAGAGVLAFLCMVPVPYHVSSEASLEGVVRRALVAPFDGYVADATARPGDRLTAGAVLLRLEDRELRLQRNDLQARIAEAQKQIGEAMGDRDNAKVNIVTARLDQAQAELNLVQDNLGRTQVTAPFDSIVVSGDKTQSIGAPVRRGDTLYEVSPLDDFRVAIDVPQADFADVDVGQTGNLLLSSVPYRSFAFAVERITPIASAREGKTTFRVEARLLDKDPLMRPGMQGVASVSVGWRPLVWIGTHHIVDWLRIKLWAWLP